MSLNNLSKENQEYILSNPKDSWFVYTKGDILKRSDINFLIHQMNCFHVMNEGLSYKIKELYINTSIADKRTINGDKSKLGSFSSSLETNVNSGKELLILNCYTQYRPGCCNEYNSSDMDSPENRLNYLTDCMTSLAEFIKLHFIEHENETKFVIGVPWLIGCGKGKNDYNKTFEIFKNVFEPIKEYITILFVDLN